MSGQSYQVDWNPAYSLALGLAMNLDELAQAFGSISDEKPLIELERYIVAWKSDDRSVKDLDTMVEKFFDDVWLSSEKVHSTAYEFWTAFRDGAIQGISGMTMNERLYFFGLFERFDSSNTEEEKNAVYAKLLAKP